MDEMVACAVEWPDCIDLGALGLGIVGFSSPGPSELPQKSQGQKPHSKSCRDNACRPAGPGCICSGKVNCKLSI